MWCGPDFNAGSLAPELEFQTLWYTHSISRCLAAYQYTCPGRENLLRTRKLGGNSGCNTYVKGKGRDVIFKEGLLCVAFITFTVFYGLPYALWYYCSFNRRTISGLERLGDLLKVTQPETSRASFQTHIVWIKSLQPYSQALSPLYLFTLSFNKYQLPALRRHYSRPWDSASPWEAYILV